MIFYNIHRSLSNNSEYESQSDTDKYYDFSISIKTAMDVLYDDNIKEKSSKIKNKKCLYDNKCNQKKCNFYHQDEH